MKKTTCSSTPPQSSQSEELTHGQTPSIKACCECYGHALSDTSLPRKHRDCYFLISAMNHMQDKYLSAAKWLLNGKDTDREVHMAAASDVRKAYGYK